MLKRIKSIVSYLFSEADKVENSNPYGFGLLKGYKDYYGNKDEREY